MDRELEGKGGTRGKTRGNGDKKRWKRGPGEGEKGDERGPGGREKAEG